MNKTSIAKLLPLILFAYHTTATATCNADRQTQTRSFGINLTDKSLSIAMDAPIGTTIYRDTIYTLPTKITCDPKGIYMGFHANTDRVGWGPNNYSFTLGSSGLSFRITRRESNGSEFYEERPRFVPVYHIDYLIPSTYNINIYKSSELSNQSKIPAGLLGSLIWDNYESVKLYLANPIVLSTASCQSPAVSVQMGDDYRLEEFNKRDISSRAKKFNITLNQCEPGIKKITYALKATTKIVNAEKGMVTLNSSSTAKGIGLKVMDDNEHPLALDKDYSFQSFNESEKNFKIPLTAAFFRLGDERLEAGTANVDVVFIIKYL